MHIFSSLLENIYSFGSNYIDSYGVRMDSSLILKQPIIILEFLIIRYLGYYIYATIFSISSRSSSGRAINFLGSMLPILP